MQNLSAQFHRVAGVATELLGQVNPRILWVSLAFVVPVGAYLLAVFLYQMHKQKRVLGENRAGLQFQNWRMWDKTIECFRNATEQDPDSAVSHYNLGYALYYGKSLWQEALEQFNIAIQLNPTMPEAFYSRGHVKFHCQSNFQGAEHDLNKALLLDPGLANPHNTLGLIRIAMNDWEGAVKEFHQALRINPKYDAAHANLGIALINLGRNAEGLLALERCTRLDPSNSIFHKNLGNACGAAHLLSEALATFRKAEEIDPNCWSTHFWIGCVLYQMSQPEKAVPRFHRALDLKGPFALANYNLALCYELLKETDLARTHMDRAIELDPTIGKDLMKEAAKT